MDGVNVDAGRWRLLRCGMPGQSSAAASRAAASSSERVAMFEPRGDDLRDAGRLQRCDVGCGDAVSLGQAVALDPHAMGEDRALGVAQGDRAELHAVRSLGRACEVSRPRSAPMISARVATAIIRRTGCTDGQADGGADALQQRRGDALFRESFQSLGVGLSTAECADIEAPASSAAFSGKSSILGSWVTAASAHQGSSGRRLSTSSGHSVMQRRGAEPLLGGEGGARIDDLDCQNRRVRPSAPAPG